MGEMSKSTSNALIRQQTDTVAEHDVEELNVQSRNTEVTFETQDYRVTAGCIAASSESSGASSDGQDEYDQDETCFAVSLSPKGLRTSRKRPKIKSKWSPVQKKMRVMESEPLLPLMAAPAELAAHDTEDRAEAAREVMERCDLTDIVLLVILIVIAIMVFTHLALAMMVTAYC